MTMNWQIANSMLNASNYMYDYDVNDTWKYLGKTVMHHIISMDLKAANSSRLKVPWCDNHASKNRKGFNSLLLRK